MGDTKRGRERKHLGKESQIIEEDLEYAKKVQMGEVSEEPPRTEEEEEVIDIEVDLELEADDD
ncbi:hypothetical protein [Haloarchaeobius amylolyticus]|uniref:hypothetical protein n=1 Tax=Haloarchaeobius amylolyticus TaxID=1198296 RepID=UPI0022707FD9|nr:hypothetical protein [Haloarchaeobius amylolyticus]